MQTKTRQFVEFALRNDDTVSGEMITQVFLLPDGKITATEQNTIPRILSRREVAEILHKSEKMVDYYARIGALTRINPTKSRKSIGFSEDSVRRLAAGAMA